LANQFSHSEIRALFRHDERQEGGRANVGQAAERLLVGAKFELIQRRYRWQVGRPVCHSSRQGEIPRKRIPQW